MIIQCPQCMKKYKYEDSRFQGESTKKIKCPNCASIFQITKRENPETKLPSDTTAIHSADAIAQARNRAIEALLQTKFISVAFLTGVLSGKVFKLQRERTTLGRFGCDIQVEDVECSRQHAEIRITTEGVYLKDLESTNGTFKDGIRVREVQLENQDEFTIGTTTIMLIIRDRESELQ